MDVNQIMEPSFEGSMGKVYPEAEKREKESFLTFTLNYVSSRFSIITITVEPELVAVVHAQTIELFKRKNYSGFGQKEVPQEYLEDNFKGEIEKKIKDFLFKYKVMGYLFEEIIDRKIHVSNYPRLKDVEVTPERRVLYHFNVSLVEPFELKEWKHFSFRSPKRKKYKDLDKQVVNFMGKEIISDKKQQSEIVEESDWVCLKSTLVDRAGQFLDKEVSGIFWIRIKKYEVADPFQELFLNKSIQQAFITDCLDLGSEAVYDYDSYQYNFLITIRSIVKGSCLSLDVLKSTFKLKNKAEIHNKLMEVFSYRDDLSQRKAIIEELFHIFLSKHRFEIPKHLILRRQEDILVAVKERPDYQVYKSQKDFELYTELLAEKQLKEEFLIDKIAYQEDVKIDFKDIQNYLHLFNNSKLREFVYFKPVIEKIDQVNVPFNEGTLKHAVLREKTLNTVIHILTR
ncbi:MAG: hypothetical protein ABH827_03545 [bacterium]